LDDHQSDLLPKKIAIEKRMGSKAGEMPPVEATLLLRLDLFQLWAMSGEIFSERVVVIGI